MWTSAGSYERVCTVTADTSMVSAVQETSPTGDTFYRISYDVILLFGMTELKAQLAWKEHVSPLS